MLAPHAAAGSFAERVLEGEGVSRVLSSGICAAGEPRLSSVAEATAASKSSRPEMPSASQEVQEASLGTLLAKLGRLG